MLSPIDMSEFAPSIPTSCSAFSSSHFLFLSVSLFLFQSWKWKENSNGGKQEKNVMHQDLPGVTVSPWIGQSCLGGFVCLVLTDRLTID